MSLTWNMHAVWLSLEAETQHSEIRSVTHPLLLLYWVFLAVLVHATQKVNQFLSNPFMQSAGYVPFRPLL